jgi:hypothetical protein
MNLHTSKLLLAGLILSLAAFADTTPAKPVRGPRGGCYIIVTSKQGKAYKKYVDPKQCPKEAK